MIYAIRLLRKSPAFTAAAILTLAFGIGANTALFSLVNGVLLKQLPFQHASRLVWIWSTRTDRDKVFYSLPDFIETREYSKAFDGFAAFTNWGANLSGMGEAERFAGARISAYAFEMMGVRAQYGRTLAASDDGPASERVVVLSHGLWQRRFGGDPQLVGQKLTLNGDSYTVAGVLPAAFAMPNTEAELFVPLVIETDPYRTNRGMNFLRVFARLKSGATEQQAAGELAAITRRLREMYPVTNGKHTDPRLIFFRDEITGGYRTSLWTLLGAVGLVLLIACSNLANLLLARSSARGREVAIRSALGASRLRLIRQFLTESFLLASLGGALGVALAGAGLRALLLLAPADLPRISEVSLDGNVLLFAIAATLVSAVVFGLAPALHASRSELVENLRAGGRASASPSATRSVLAVAEVALSIVLLICAGLFLKTFVRLQAATPGFVPGHLLLVRLSLPAANYHTPVSIRNFYDELRRRLVALPGVQSVALGSLLPLSGANNRNDILISGRKPASPLDIPAAQNRWVSAGYFQTLRIPVKEGREFTDRDTETAPGVAVVDRTFASRYWPNQSPLGRHFRMEDREFEIVGVVGDVKHNTLEEEPTQTVYAPFSQVTSPGLPFLAGGFNIVLRSTSDPLALATAVRRALHAVDANVPASSVKTMDQFMSRAVAPRRFNLRLISVLAGAALLLAGMGLYAVISYSVSLRTSEIGIRMALGADTRAVLKLIIGQGLRLVLIGIAVGLAASAAVSRAIASLLFETNSADPFTFAAAALLFATVGIVAAYLPARRAIRIDPLTALRAE
jgi:predicted permease